jgi:hypothetical protein
MRHETAERIINELGLREVTTVTHDTYFEACGIQKPSSVRDFSINSRNITRYMLKGVSAQGAINKILRPEGIVLRSNSKTNEWFTTNEEQSVKQVARYNTMARTMAVLSTTLSTGIATRRAHGMAFTGISE